MLREGRAFFFSKIREIARSNSKACRSEMKCISSVVNQRYLIGGIMKRLKADGGESVEVAVCFSAEKIFPPSMGVGRREANNYWAAGSDTCVMYQPVVIKSCFVVS